MLAIILTWGIIDPFNKGRIILLKVTEYILSTHFIYTYYKQCLWTNLFTICIGKRITNKEISSSFICIPFWIYVLKTAFHQHFGSDVTSESLALNWLHRHRAILTCAAQRYIAAQTRWQALILCDITTKVLVKWRISNCSPITSILWRSPLLGSTIPDNCCHFSIG